MPTDTAVSQSAVLALRMRACTISSGGCQDAKKDFMRSPDSCEEEQLLGGIEPRLSSTCNVCSLTLMSYVIVKLLADEAILGRSPRSLAAAKTWTARWRWWPSAVAASAMFICTFPCPPRPPKSRSRGEASEARGRAVHAL